jgi:glycosyltransferase involved in cell wall biosynthesis
LKRVLAVFPAPPGFSGQREAAEQILRALEDSPAFQMLPVRLPGFPRTEGGLLPKIKYVTKTIQAILLLVYYSLRFRLDVVYLGLCQTRLPLLRELLLIRVIKVLQFKTRIPVVASLHGSVFMTWDGGEPVAKIFKRALSHACKVTVLGPNQKKWLSHRFVEPDVATIVPNSCEVPLVSEAELTTKHSHSRERQSILHLSTLMEPKGYANLIDAIPMIDEEFDLVLCGRLTQTQYDRRFKTLSDARRFVEDGSQEHGFRWVEGAYGAEKNALFEQASIFVLPSFYPVEAQPLVLLEAMASGCAIITTDVGEISYMMGDGAEVIPDVNPATIAAAINKLIADPEERLRLALRGRDRFCSHFSMAKYRDTWHSLFSSAGT